MNLDGLIVMKFELNYVRLSLKWMGNVELKRNFKEKSMSPLCVIFGQLSVEGFEFVSSNWYGICIWLCYIMYLLEGFEFGYGIKSQKKKQKHIFPMARSFGLNQ
jgi:hypothetical protein